jgi:hypothetical protein
LVGENARSERARCERGDLAVDGPVDFWRYTPDALTFLFDELNVVECDFDLVERRRDMRKKSTRDPMPIDALGGWRENVRVFHAGVKP